MLLLTIIKTSRFFSGKNLTHALFILLFVVKLVLFPFSHSFTTATFYEV